MTTSREIAKTHVEIVEAAVEEVRIRYGKNNNFISADYGISQGKHCVKVLMKKNISTGLPRISEQGVPIVCSYEEYL